MAVVLERN